MSIEDISGWSPESLRQLNHEICSMSDIGWGPEDISAFYEEIENSYQKSPVKLVSSFTESKRRADELVLSGSRPVKYIDTRPTPVKRENSFLKKDPSELLQFQGLKVTETTSPDEAGQLLSLANLDSALPNGWSLFEHQKEAIRLGLQLKRFILAYDMGLGKTIIGLKWAWTLCTTSKKRCVAVVIAPCTLLTAWKREAEVMGFEICPSNSDLKVENKATARPRLILSSWAKILLADEILANDTDAFIVVADEAHAMQNMTSKRTRSMLDLCHHLSCVGCLLATGTPMKNGRPSNIFPLLRAIRHPLAADKTKFEVRYCNARKTPYCAWDVSGARNLEELKEKIGHYLLRKTKDECLDLPPLSRKQVAVEFSPESLRQCRDLLLRLERQRGPGATSKFARGQQLELLTQLRQLTSVAKVDGTMRVIANHFQCRSDPLVVFVNFIDTAHQLAEKTARLKRFCETNIKHTSLDNEDAEDCSEAGLQEDSDSCWSNNSGIHTTENLRIGILTGEIGNREERQKLVDNFQENGKIDVLVCTYGVGSTGLTLTRSRTVILLDRPWTPGDVKQAEDRVRRIGQSSDSVESVWITAYDFDDKINELLQSKDNRCQQVLADVGHTKLLKKHQEIKGSITKKNFRSSFNKSVRPSEDLRMYFERTSQENEFVD